MQIFFGCNTLKLVKPWVVRLAAEKGTRGAWRGRVSLGRRGREKTWEVKRPKRASGPDPD
jgi:hypothetical protein